MVDSKTGPCDEAWSAPSKITTIVIMSFLWIVWAIFVYKIFSVWTFDESTSLREALPMVLIAVSMAGLLCYLRPRPAQ